MKGRRAYKEHSWQRICCFVHEELWVGTYRFSEQMVGYCGSPLCLGKGLEGGWAQVTRMLVEPSLCFKYA